MILVEILYPERRGERWVSDRGLAACGVGLALWMPVLMALNPFVPPASGFLLSWLAIAALAYTAWRLPAQVLPLRTGTGARPLYYGVLAATNMTLVFLAVFMLPEANPSWLPPWPATLAFIALLDAGALWLILRWSGNGAAWDEQHKLALVSGMLAFFIVFDVLKDLDQGFGGLSLVAFHNVGLAQTVDPCTISLSLSLIVRLSSRRSLYLL